MSKKLTTEEFKKKARKVHGNRFDYKKTIYILSQQKVIIHCNIHNIDFTQRPSNHLRGIGGCVFCANEIKSKKVVGNKKEFIEKARKKHGFKYIYSRVIYKSRHKKVKIICRTHGEFEQSPNNHIKGQGCPEHHDSLGEEKIKKFLRKYKIKFIFQKTFDDCKYKRCLPFDFYIKSLNMLIEFDGHFHYEVSRYYCGDKKLRETQRNDRMKTRYAKKKGIKLLRISYKKFNNIDEILTKKVLCLNNKHEQRRT